MNKNHTAIPHLHSSINHLIDYYILHVAQYQKAFRQSEKYRFNQLKKHLGHYALVELSPEIITVFINKRLLQVKSGTAKRDVCALQRCLNWYRKDMCMRIDDQFKHVRLPSDSGIREFIPTDKQVNDIIELLPIHIKPIIILLAETACRRNEILKLTRDDINLEQRTIHLRNTKNGTDRVVPLSKKAVTVLSERLKYAHHKLFSVSPEQVTKQFRKAADKTECYECVVHSLRHYKISKLVQQGVDHIIVGKISGHKDIRMLQRYVKLDASQFASLMD
ncbi:TPA: site-specific integrase [Photobacterium damselae]